jgi:hypothetical protein
MKIKITESQLEELYKSTYNSAAAESVEQGNEELALDFLKHSNEMGIDNGLRYDPTKVVHKDDDHVVLDLDQGEDEFTYDKDDITYQDNDWLVIDIDDEDKTNYDFYGVGSSDMDVDGIPDDEDDELSVDRFDIRQRIQSELNTMLNEVGGYDDHNTMASHGGHIHGMLSRTILETINILSMFINHLQDDTLTKNQIMAGVSNLSDKFYSDNKMIKDLSGEIFLDDDFKELIINYVNATNKVLKYFRMLSGFDTGIVGGKPVPLSYGLGNSMTDSELRLRISEKLSSLGEYIEKLGDMFKTILMRYQSRLEN